MASAIYNILKKDIMDGTIDLDTDTIKAALVTVDYTPNIDTHTAFSDVTNEVTATGYTAGGATLASVSVSADNGNDKGIFDAGDTTWTSSIISARAAVLYKETSATSTSPLIAYIDFGANKSSQLGDLKITWSSAGIVNLN